MVKVTEINNTSPNTLRYFGSRDSLFFNYRKKLQSSSRHTSQSKPSTPDTRPRFKQENDDLKSLLAASILRGPSPVSPKSPISYPLAKEPPSETSDDFNDEELDEEIQRPQACDTPDLFVVGSKPWLHGMWEVSVDTLMQTRTSSSGSVPLNTEGDGLELTEQTRAASPGNPPPSPVHFRQEDEDFLVGGNRLSYPQRAQSTLGFNNRDFNPGFVKEKNPLCEKCQSRTECEELSQLTLGKRLSRILTTHVLENLRQEQALLSRKTMRLRQHLIERSRSVSCATGTKSYRETLMERKRIIAEKESKLNEQRMTRVTELHDKKMAKLKEQIRLKEQKSCEQLTIVRKTRGRATLRTNSCPVETTLIPTKASGKKNIRTEAEKNVSKKKVVDECQVTKTSHSGEEANLAPVTSTYTDFVRRTQTSSVASGANEGVVTGVDLVYMPCNTPRASSTDSEDIPYQQLGVRSKEVLNVEDIQVSHAESLEESRENCMTQETGTARTEIAKADGNSTVTLIPDEECSTKTRVISCATTTTDEQKISQESTMSSAVIVPEKDTACSQWISFNGDNEPVLNTSPDVDPNCDTFLRRLQRTKVQAQSDSSLPSGQQFCFEAVVDKRYNRWKRRRRKKEIRRATVNQGSESSDDSDGRNDAMERIIDKMYEEINGPPPQTPNGSRDTPRARNRRRRKEESYGQLKYIDSEPDLHSLHYDASAEWMSSDSCMLLSPYAEKENGRPESCVKFELGPEQQMDENDAVSDDVCSWPYLEQYKLEMMKRIKETPPEQLEELDSNQWLPELNTPDNAVTEGNRDNEDGSQPREDLDLEDGEEYRNQQGQEEAQNSCHDDEDDENKDSSDDSVSNYVETFVKEVHVKRFSRNRAENTPVQRVRRKDQCAQDLIIEASQHPAYDTLSKNPRQDVSEKPRPRLLSRSSMTSGMVSGQETPKSSAEERSEPVVLWPDKRQDSRSSTKKSNKLVLNITKKTMNLPSLTKNTRGQMMPYSTRRDAADSPTTVQKSVEERPTMKTSPRKPTARETQAVPDFLVRDVYLRHTYDNTIRSNSHIKSKGVLKKTITVDNLQQLKKTSRKEDNNQPNNLDFTRSFTFSMFDLPEMYKLYNTNLERRAKSEQIEVFE